MRGGGGVGLIVGMAFELIQFKRILERIRTGSGGRTDPFSTIKVGDEGRSETVDGRGTREHSVCPEVWLARAELT